MSQQQWTLEKLKLSNYGVVQGKNYVTEGLFNVSMEIQ